MALVDEHIKLLQFLEPSCDLLPSTIDAYTRLNHYEKAAEGIARSVEAGTSLLNGFPAVNHGLAECRRVVAVAVMEVTVDASTSISVDKYESALANVVQV